MILGTNIQQSSNLHVLRILDGLLSLNQSEKQVAISIWLGKESQIKQIDF